VNSNRQLRRGVRTPMATTAQCVTGLSAFCRHTRIAPAQPPRLPSFQPAVGRHPEERSNEGSLPLCPPPLLRGYRRFELRAGRAGLLFGSETDGVVVTGTQGYGESFIEWGGGMS
jgi:hypothetical protein